MRALTIAIVLIGAVPAMAAEPSADQVQAMRTAMDVVLLDEPSARYADLRMVQDANANGPVVCGRVNAKNAMGGYAGWQPFAWVVGARLPVLRGSVAGSAEIVARMCGE